MLILSVLVRALLLAALWAGALHVVARRGNAVIDFAYRVPYPRILNYVPCSLYAHRNPKSKNIESV